MIRLAADVARITREIVKNNLKSLAGSVAVAVCLVPSLAQAQYLVQSKVNDWSSHSYNVDRAGSYLRTATNSTASGTATSAFSRTYGGPPPNGSYDHAPTMDSIEGVRRHRLRHRPDEGVRHRRRSLVHRRRRGEAYAAYHDTLTLSVAGGTATTQTSILVTFRQSGFLWQSRTFAQGNGESFGVLTIGSNGAISSGARIRSNVQLGGGTGTGRRRTWTSTRVRIRPLR